MKYRRLGKTELRLSEIGLGCSGFWGGRLFDDEKAIGIITAAHELGINIFDTGSNYSNFNAEPRLGRAVKQILANNKRDSIVLSTKAGSQKGYAPTVEDDDTRSSDYSPAALEKSCLNSIKNLNCEYIDIFQLHGFDKDNFTDEQADFLVSLKKRGLARYVGVNTHFLGDMEYILQRPEVFDMVLTDCNVLQLDRIDIIERLHANGIGVLVGTVMAQGYLVRRKIGAIGSGAFFWYLARSILKPTTRDFALHSGRMRKTLNSLPEMTAAQAAFARLLESPAVTSCLFGTTRLENLREIAAVPEKKLSAESLAAIQATYNEMGKTLSR